MNIDYNSIPPQKAQLLKDFMAMSQGKTQDELLPLLMAFFTKARQEHISFSKDEMSILIESIKKDLPPAEQEKMSRIIEMAFTK